MAISRGKQTYDAEGMDGIRYYSCVLHVPQDRFERRVQYLLRQQDDSV